MSGEALGVIEVVGMAAAIQAADSCVKSGNVELIGHELTKGSGLVVIKIRGNVGAVKAALEAAKVSASKVSEVYATLIIPRPAHNLAGIIKSSSTVGIRENKNELKESSEENITVDIKEDIEIGIKEDTELKEKKLEDIKLLNISDYYENDQEDENKVNNDNGHEEESLNDVVFFNEDESDDICNICHDPKCQRRKGQPRNLCIHYKRA